MNKPMLFQRLPRLILPYSSQVKARYRYHLGSSKPPDALDVVLERDESVMTWADLELLQNAILDLEDISELRRHVWALREEVKETVSPIEYADYLASLPPALATASRDDLEGDARQLVAWLNAAYALQFAQSRVRNWISRCLSLGILAFLVLLVALAFGLRIPGAAGTSLTFVVVIVAGLMGAMISTQQRLQKTVTQTVSRLMVLESGRFTTLLSPLSGPIFALVLFMLFVGGLVKGELFPKIDAPPGGNWSIFLIGASPDSAVDLAKLAIWSFIAGFFERLVPDTLNRLAMQAVPTPTPSGPPASGVTTPAPVPAPAQTDPETA